MSDTIHAVWIGDCDICHSTKQFSSEHAKDLWMTHHPHERGDDDDC